MVIMLFMFVQNDTGEIWVVSIAYKDTQLE